MNMESDAGGSAAMFSCVWDGGVWVWMEGSNLHGIDVQHTAVPAEQHGCKLSSLYVCYWAAVGAALSAAHPLSRVNVEKLKAAKSWYSCTFMEICILFGKKCQKKKLVPPVFVDSRRTSCLSYLLCFPWLWQSLQHSCCPGSREPSKLD